MKSFTIEELHEIYNELKFKWGYIDTKEFLEILEVKSKEND
jgi:Ca2+-binding EF-hand superfamily protein